MLQELYYTYYESPIGILKIAGTETVIAEVSFVDSTNQMQHGEPGVSDVLHQCTEELIEFFSGKRRAFSVPIHQEGNDFSQQVWSTLTQITYGKTISFLELAKKVLRNIVKTSSKEITIDNIQKMVCDYYDIGYDKLQAKTRKREIVQARQISMFLAKQFTKNSLKTIGDHFGGRDHTTVIHSCQTVKDLMDTDGVFRENVLELQQKVQLAAM